MLVMDIHHQLTGLEPPLDVSPLLPDSFTSPATSLFPSQTLPQPIQGGSHESAKISDGYLLPSSASPSFMSCAFDSESVGPSQEARLLSPNEIQSDRSLSEIHPTSSFKVQVTDEVERMLFNFYCQYAGAWVSP